MKSRKNEGTKAKNYIRRKVKFNSFTDPLSDKGIDMLAMDNVKASVKPNFAAMKTTDQNKQEEGIRRALRKRRNPKSFIDGNIQPSQAAKRKSRRKQPK